MRTFTLKQIINDELGLDYMEIIRDGNRPSETAIENLYHKCDICGKWIENDDLAVSSGQIGTDICKHCLLNKIKNSYVQEGIDFLKSQGEYADFIKDNV